VRVIHGRAHRITPQVIADQPADRHPAKADVLDQG